LIKSALDDQEYGWLKESTALEDLWRANMLELQTLAKDFLPDEDLEQPLNPAVVERWRRRYEQAVERINAAKIKTSQDGVDDYISLRKQWHRIVYMLAPKFAYDMDEIDTALAKIK
jgi:hypothetical protein